MDRSKLLWGLILAPFFYYIGLFGCAMLWPGYSHISQYASELGSAASPCPTFFNGNVILCGMAALVGGFGLSQTLAELSGRRNWAIAAGASISLWGLAIVIGGLYPMPDARHGAYGLSIIGQFTPLFTLIALNRVEGLAPLKSFLAFIFIASLALFAIMMGVGELVTRDNVGIWQRTYGVLSIPYLAILGWVLIRRTEQIRTA